MRKIVITGLLFLSLAACVKQADWLLQQQTDTRIFVDGIITDESRSQAVRLTHAVNQLNEVPKPVTGANVIITDEDSVYTLTEQPALSGVYYTEPWFIAKPGKHYNLHIYLDDRIYTAQSSLVPGEDFTPLHYVKNDDDDLYHIDYVASAFNTANPAMWEILLDWSLVPGYENRDPSECKARLLFYTLPTLDVSEIFAPMMQRTSFPAGTVVDERRYSLTPEHAEFVRAYLLETNWQGGLFCSQPANVLTNLSPGAAGFFGACSITAISLIVNP
jgi:hypothetical protein